MAKKFDMSHLVDIKHLPRYYGIIGVRNFNPTETKYVGINAGVYSGQFSAFFVSQCYEKCYDSESAFFEEYNYKVSIQGITSKRDIHIYFKDKNGNRVILEKNSWRMIKSVFDHSKRSIYSASFTFEDPGHKTVEIHKRSKFSEVDFMTTSIIFTNASLNALNEISQYDSVDTYLERLNPQLIDGTE